MNISDKFRVVSEGGTNPTQWFLERLRGGKWKAISFCQTREGLLLAIREKCLDEKDFSNRHNYPGLNQEAISKIKEYPERHPK